MSKTGDTLIPNLVYADADAAIKWLDKAFGFACRLRVEGEGGAIAHAQLAKGPHMIMLSSIRTDELICDGALLATPAGSTAYNLSAHGPILPIDAKLLALTPISAFRPRRWRGALLPETAQVTFTALEAEKRPISAVADHSEFRNIVEVSISQSKAHELLILFDGDHSLDERILAEQFMP